jgi:hypothetical protein
MQDVARTVQQQFATLSDIKLPAAAVQAITAFGWQQAQFAASWRSALARVQPIAEEFSKQFIDLANAVHKSFQARLELYPKLAEKVVPLAQRGWFISEYFGLTEIDQLVHAAATPSLDELERCIARLYEENFSLHLQDIIRHYPEREFVLRPAGDAHLRGEYALSVMAFFAQIDGICFQGTERYVFQGGTNTSHLWPRSSWKQLSGVTKVIYTDNFSPFCMKSYGYRSLRNYQCLIPKRNVEHLITKGSIAIPCCMVLP